MPVYKLTGRILWVSVLTAMLIGSVGAEELPTETGGDPAVSELDCVIEPSEVADVGSAVPGVIESIYAGRTDFVKKGGIIADLESSVERATLELTKLRAEQETAIMLRQESAALGQRTQKRNRKLYSKSAISEQIMDETETQTRIARYQVQQEQDNLRIAELEYMRSQAALQRRSIRSPVDGVVMERFKSVGEYVEDEPVLRVAQLDPLHVEVIAPVESLGLIVPGMQANVTIDVAGFGTHLAKVERVDRVADAASGTYGVRLVLPNPEYSIPAGIRCRSAFLPWESEVPEGIAETGNRTMPVENGGESLEEEASTSDSESEVTTGDPVQERLAESSAAEPEYETLETRASDSKSEPAASEPPPAPPATASNEVPIKRVDIPASAPNHDPAAGDSVSDAPALDAIDAPQACYTVGPVATEELARRLSEGLGAQSANVSLREEPVEVEYGYRLLTTPEPSRQATRELLNRLRSAGISDFYLLGSGEYAGRASLGFFRNKNNVARLQQRVATRGFETEIVPERKNTTRFWLDVSLPAGSEKSDRFQEVVASLDPSVSLEALSCAPQIAQGDPRTGAFSH